LCISFVVFPSCFAQNTNKCVVFYPTTKQFPEPPEKNKTIQTNQPLGITKERKRGRKEERKKGRKEEASRLEQQREEEQRRREREEKQEEGRRRIWKERI